MENKTLVAMIYDFDKTLCDKDMQEYSFIPNLGMSPKEFWNKTNNFSNLQKMDKILSCMYTMVNESKKNNKNLTKEYLNSLGKDIIFFEGILDWFERINKYGEELGLTIVNSFVDIFLFLI